MRISLLLRWSVVVVAASSLALVAHAAPSGPAPASDSAPKAWRLAPGDAAAEKACVDKGGKVSTDADGTKMCAMSSGCPAPGGRTRTVKLDANDPAAAQKCKNACGVVSNDASGAMVCTRPEG